VELDFSFSNMALAVIAGILAWMVPIAQEVKRNVRDLWDWHKPNDNGVQTWKGQGKGGGEE